MKKIYFVLVALIACLFVSCSESTFVVNGTVTESEETNGAIIVMTDLFTSEADTTTIVDGTFSFSGVADPTTLKRIYLYKADNSRSRNFSTFVPEKGVIEVSLDSANAVVANGPVNTARAQYNADLKAMRDEFNAFLDTLEGLSEEEYNAKGNEAYQAFSEKRNALNKETFTANKDNAIALDLLIQQQMMYDIEDLADFDALLEGAAPFVTENKTIVKYRESLIALDNTAEGKMFSDFTGEAPDGSKRSLSDFVGKGNYVLVDFWASWCGPCRGEIPNLVRIHKEYASKGIVVLGVPVWDKRPDTDKAIEEMGIKYEQIFMGDDRTPTTIYGISGIPQIMLFAPDGTIYKRNLRGEKIEETIKSVL